MTPKEAEELVRARWKGPIFAGDNSGHGFISADDLSISDWSESADEAWLSAAEFTLQREEEIRTARRAKSLLAAFQGAISQDDTDRWDALQYLYGLLEAQLAALLVGWKETP